MPDNGVERAIGQLQASVEGLQKQMVSVKEKVDEIHDSQQRQKGGWKVVATFAGGVGAVPGDPWPGVENSDAIMQTAFDDLATWRDGVTPPTGAVVRAKIAAWQASIPTSAELDEIRREAEAQQIIDGAIHKTVRDALWDMESRLRALGSDSASPDIAGAATKTEYTAVLKGVVKGYLP